MEEAVTEFFTIREMPSVWRRTFITLIPKKSDATDPCHFHLVSLCSTLYKICAKLMEERMKPVLPCLIYPEYETFIGGRSITDNVMVTYEFMHDL